MSNREQAKSLINFIMIIGMKNKQKATSLTTGEMGILGCLQVHDGLKPKELIEYTGCSSAHIAKSIRNLSAKGYITRNITPLDKRSAVISLTEQGRNYINNIYTNAIDMTEKLLDRLGEKDSSDLVRIIGTISAFNSKGGSSND